MRYPKPGVTLGRKYTCFEKFEYRVVEKFRVQPSDLNKNINQPSRYSLTIHSSLLIDIVLIEMGIIYIWLHNSSFIGKIDFVNFEPKTLVSKGRG